MNLYFENIIHDLQNADNEEILLILLKCLKLQKKWIKDSDLNYKLLLELSKHLHKDNRIFALLLRVRKQIDFMFPRWSSVDQKSARILIVNIFESPEASEEQRLEIEQHFIDARKELRDKEKEDQFIEK